MKEITRRRISGDVVVKYYNAGQLGLRGGGEKWRHPPPPPTAV
jgi:hypothetical protein